MGTSINWLARLSQEDQERILGHIERLVKLERKLSKEILEDEDMTMEYVENDGDADVCGDIGMEVVLVLMLTLMYMQILMLMLKRIRMLMSGSVLVMVFMML